MDLSLYFQPLGDPSENLPEESLGVVADRYLEGASFPSLEAADLAIVGVTDDRQAVNNSGCAHGPDAIRQHFYRLFQGDYAVRLADLGNILPGETLDDTYHAVSEVVSQLVRQKVIPIILGGGQDLTYANYLAYGKLEQVINLVAVDNRFDLGEADQPISSNSYLNKIILDQPNYLFNYSNIGYQTYFEGKQSLDLMSKLFFDVHRLGEVRANMREVEPIVRNADVLSFDVSALRHSDAPGNGNATPNGFYGEEACQILRYAGLSDKLTSLGFYEMNPLMDPHGQTAHLIAQMMWYFMDGYYHRKQDQPSAKRPDYLRYRVALKDLDNEIIFYKSLKSDRWWMDVPHPPGKRSKYIRHHLVPCTYSDYQLACQEEVPDKWWRTYQKLS